MGNTESLFRAKLSEFMADPAQTQINDSQQKYNDEFNNKIPEFPYMNTRLRPIDWQSIVLADERAQNQWSDPYFKADKNAIIDPMIQRSNRIKSW